VKRISALAVLAAVALAGCKEPTPFNPAAPVTGSSNIEIRSAQVYQATVGATDMNQGYYLVCKLVFTNDLGHDVTPQPKNFLFYDASAQPHVGVDSGASALVGISNYAGVVKKDAKQEYTIGFRIQSVSTGSVYYTQVQN
jgi:hypothetical protein